MKLYAFLRDGEMVESTEPPEISTCDFCALPEVHHLFTARDHALPEIDAPGAPEVSEGAWAACQRCTVLIRGERWKDLADRAMARFLKAHPEARADRARLRRLLERVHEGFRQHYRRDD